MTAFNTATNTGSTTFTNAWGTISLLPSASPQYVYGFKRTTGWRYFEVKVEDQGGDQSRLLFGTAGQICNYIVGGPNAQTAFFGGVTSPSHPYANYLPSSPAISLTACVGDVFMFSVDMTGSARDHNGNALTATTSSGAGEILTCLAIEVGKNGVWGGSSFISFAWPSHGFPMEVTPLVLRDSTSSSAAMVSLRVETTSFAYAIPTGMVAWSDGPEGSIASGTDTAVYWDPAKVSVYISLSASNQYAVVGVSNTASATLNIHWIYSTQLPNSGKRVIETFNNGAHFAPNIALSLADADATITSSVDSSTKKIGRNLAWNNYYQRSVAHITSITQSSEGNNFYGETPGQILYIDFDAARYWQTGGYIAGGGVRQECWTGDKNASEKSDPFAGTSGLTFTNSVGLRLCAELNRTDSLCNTSVFLNVGQRAFETFPLLPPYKSMNGGRQVYGIGAAWNTAISPASMSFQASDLLLRDNATCRMQGTVAKYSGKWYFEIFRQAQGNAGDWVGISTADATTVSATNNALVLDDGMWFNAFAKKKNRYGAATLSWTNSSSAISGGDIQAWFGVAVDFDAGKIWCGCWNRNARQMNWVSGADPTTGTQPDFTFTASTTMNIGLITSGTGNITALVAEDGNVIGLPSGFETWNGTTISASPTATPSGTTGSNRVLWPYGVQT